MKYIFRMQKPGCNTVETYQTETDDPGAIQRAAELFQISGYTNIQIKEGEEEEC